MAKAKSHWEEIYSTSTPDDLSWTQSSPSPSIEWIKATLPNREAGVIDIGGGNSRLVDALLNEGFSRPAVLDLSASALSQTQARLGEKRSDVE